MQNHIGFQAHTCQQINAFALALDAAQYKGPYQGFSGSGTVYTPWAVGWGGMSGGFK